MDDSSPLEESVIRDGEVRAFNNGEKAFSSFPRDPVEEEALSLSLGFSKRANV
jgi:hypothetical protein